METLASNDFRVIELISSRNSGGRIHKALVEHLGTQSRYLIKSGTPFGHEPVSEVLAYHIGTALGFSICPYYLLESKQFTGILNTRSKYLSMCPMLDTSTHQVVSITHIKNELNAQRVMLGQSQLSNLDTAKMVMSKESFDKMIFFDAIIGNKDRHWRNVHVFKNFYGAYSECPLIDNGDSLLATDFIPHAKVALNKSATIAQTHDKQVESITTIDTSSWNPVERAETATRAIGGLLEYLGTFRSKQVQKYLYTRVIKYYTKLQHRGQ